MRVLIKKINKIIDETKIVELQIFKVILAILFIIPFTWGVSQAENIIFSEDIESATTNFSLIGIVSEIKYNKIIIEQATGSDNENKNIYVLDIVHLEKVETSTYAPLTLSDINIGATVIAQGFTNGKDYFITRIVSFASALPTPIPVDDTASSTTDIEIAS